MSQALKYITGFSPTAIKVKSRSREKEELESNVEVPKDGEEQETFLGDIGMDTTTQEVEGTNIIHIRPCQYASSSKPVIKEECEENKIIKKENKQDAFIGDTVIDGELGIVPSMLEDYSTPLPKEESITQSLEVSSHDINVVENDVESSTTPSNDNVELLTENVPEDANSVEDCSSTPSSNDYHEQNADTEINGDNTDSTLSPNEESKSITEGTMESKHEDKDESDETMDDRSMHSVDEKSESVNDDSTQIDDCEKIEIVDDSPASPEEKSESATEDIQDDKEQPNDEKSQSFDMIHDDDNDNDDDDPFGFEAEQEQDLLNDDFRLSYDDELEACDTATVITFQSIKSRAAPSHSRNSHDRENAEAHPNQALFDILDQNFDGIVPFGDDIGSEQVKLCFVTFVMILMPPNPISYAAEYNHSIDDEISKNLENLPPSHERSSKSLSRWFFRKKNENDTVNNQTLIVSQDASTSTSGSSQLDEKEPEFRKVPIPLQLVHILWIKLLSGRYSCDENNRESVLNYIQKHLIDLGLVEVVKDLDPVDQTVTKDSNEDDNLQHTMVVHHSINQQYGQYLGKFHYNEVLKENKNEWFSVVSEECDKNGSYRSEAFSIHSFPNILIHSGSYDDTRTLLCSASYIQSRLKLFGILDGTTSHITDMDSFLVTLEWNKHHGTGSTMNVGNIILLAYDHIRKYIEETLTHEAKGSGRYHKFNQAGKALHLMAISFGAQGYVEKEIEYYTESLKLKRFGLRQYRGLSESVSISDTLHCLGFAHDNLGRFEEAIASYDQALRIRYILLGHENLRVAETSHNKGAILCENGQLQGARKCLYDALKIRKQHFGDEHESVADTYQWMGNVMREFGNYHQALDNFKTSLKIKKKLFGDHEDVANILHNMAIVLDDLQDYKKSLESYEEALRIRKDIFGPQNRLVADTLLCMGNVCNELSLHERALGYFKESIRIRESDLTEDAKHLMEESFICTKGQIDMDKKLGYERLIECYEEAIPLTKLLSNDSSDIVVYLERIGEIYYAIFDWNNSLQCLVEAMRVKRSTKSKSEVTNSSHGVNLLQKIGKICIFTAEFRKAQKMLNEASRESKRLEGSDSISSATSFYCIGVSFHKLQEYQQALSSFTGCIRILKRKGLTKDILMANTLHWLGLEHFHLREYSKAISRYTSSIRVYQECGKSQASNQAIFRTLHLLGNAHFRCDQLDLALKCFNEEILFYEKTRNSHNCPNIAEAYYSAGNIYAKMDDIEHAIISYNKSLDESNGEEHDDEKIARKLEKLGSMYLKKSEFIQAREIMTKAYDIIQQLPTLDETVVSNTAFKLGQIHLGLNEYSHAMIFYKECLHIREKDMDRFAEEIGTTLFYMGRCSFSTSNFVDAEKYLERSLRMRRDKFGINNTVVASTLQELGKCYATKGSKDKAMVCYKESLRIWKVAGGAEFAAEVSAVIAKLHESTNHSELAIQFYDECLELMDGLTNDLTSRVNYRLGFLHNKLRNWSKSKKHLLTCKDDFRMKSSEDYIAIMRLLCKSNVMADNYDDALSCYSELINALQEQGNTDPGDLADIFFAIGEIWERIPDQEDAAMDNYQKSLSIKKKVNGEDDLEMANLLLSIALIYEKKEKLEEASNNLLEALRIFKLKGDLAEAATSLSILARINAIRNNTVATIECYEECIRLKREDLGSDSLSLASSMYDFGCFMMKTGNLEKALELLQFVFDLRESKIGMESLVTVQALKKIGELYMGTNQFNKALPCLEETLQATIQILGNDHEDVSFCHQAIGTAHFEQGDYSKAIEFLKNALAIQQDKGNKLAIASTLHKLGRSYGKIEDLTSASHSLKEAVRIRMDILGIQSTEYAESLKYLGDIHYSNNSIEEALKCYAEALKICQKNCNQSLIVANIQESIGKVLLTQQQYRSALIMLDRCHAIYKEKLGDNDGALGNVHFYKGKAFASQHNADEAMNQYKLCLRIRKSKGKETMEVVEVLMEVGNLLLSQSQCEHALKCFEETKRIILLRNADNEHLGLVFRRLGDSQLKGGDYKAAISSFEESRTKYLFKFGEDSVQVGELDCNIGLALDAAEQTSEARERYLSGLNILRQHLGDDNLALAQIMHNLGLIYAKDKDSAEALSKFTDALNIRRKKLDENSIYIADTLYHLATTLKESGDTPRALKSLREAAKICSHLNENNLLVKCFHEIGTIQFQEGKEEEAFTTLTEALTLIQDGIMNDTALSSSILYHLGSIYKHKSEYEKALGHLRQCLQIQMKELGEKNIKAAKTCGEIGSVLMSLERYDDALKILLAALKTYHEVLDKDDIRFATIHQHLGDVYSKKEEYDFALKQYKDCFRIYHMKRGEQSEDIACIHIRMASITDKALDNEETMKHMISALNIRTSIFGKDHEKVAETFVQMGKFSEDWGDSDEAMGYFRAAVRIYDAKFGKKSIHTADIYSHIGNLYAENDDFDSALESFKEAKAIHVYNSTNDSPKVGQILQDIGTIYDARQEYDKSLICYSKALQILKSASENDLSVAFILNNMGIATARRKEYGKAIQLCTEALRIRKKALEKDHPDIADTLFNIGNIFVDWGGNNEMKAMQFYMEALSTYRSNSSEDSEDVATCLQSIGSIYMRVGKFDEALRHLMDSLRIFRLKQGETSLQVADILFNLGRVYGKKFDYAKSLRCFRECLRIREESNDGDIAATKTYIEAIQRKIGK